MTDNILYDLYYNKRNFDGVDKLYTKAKKINPNISFNEVNKWLKKQATYQLNYNKKEKKQFLPIYSEVPNAYQIDLTFFPRYKKQNKNNYVLFTAIEINTRYAYADYSKDKNADTIINIFKKFIKNVGDVNKIDGDLGSEFTNKKFKEFLKSKNIDYNFFKSDSHKLGIINRFHRTLKDKLTKYMVAFDTVKWIDVIDKIIDNYNNTYHRGIDTIPIIAHNNEIVEKIILTEKRNNKNNINKTNVEYHIDERVRHKLNNNMFEDKMTNKFSNEIYKVKNVKKNVIIVEDSEGKEHTFKKNNVIKVDNIENYKEPINIKKDKKENKVVRLMKKEDLINEPRLTRLRVNPKKKKNEDFIY